MSEFVIRKARELLQQNKVTERIGCRVFTVEGQHDTYTVIVSGDVAPDTCSCPAVVQCSHLLAAQHIAHTGVPA